MCIKTVVFVGLISVIMAAPLLSDQEEWQKYKLEHNKNYSGEEEQQRFHIFQENLDKIREHNKKFEKGEVTWEMGINQFTDMTPDEKKQYLGYGVRRKGH